MKIKLKPIKIFVQYEDDGDVINITELDFKRYEAFLDVMKDISIMYRAIKSTKSVEEG
jgi:hypothetical protein